jgi:hypothetical protein
MTTRMSVLSAAAAAAFILTGCATDSEQAKTDKPKWPQPEAASVWSYIESHDYRENWSFWPGKGELYKGQEPHGALLTTYVNDLAKDALTNKADKMPRGSVIVKENYGPDKKLAATTVMYKAEKGYNPDHNDWFFMKRLADGSVEASGRVDSCQACHSSSQRDYLMTPLP